MGAEFGGILGDEAFSSSGNLEKVDKDGKEFQVGQDAFGRLNYPSFATTNASSAAGWYAKEGDHAPWLQIDFGPQFREIRGIITQGGDYGNNMILSSDYR